VPAPGQGTLALEARAGDERFAELNDPETFAALAAEREAVRLLGASCHTPVGVWAHRRTDGTRWMSGFAGLPDGSEWLHDEIQTDDGAVLAERMLAAGAAELLARAEAFAA
jgi:hydroxymethylbilane synthase